MTSWVWLVVTGALSAAIMLLSVMNVMHARRITALSLRVESLAARLVLLALVMHGTNGTGQQNAPRPGQGEGRSSDDV